MVDKTAKNSVIRNFRITVRWGEMSSHNRESVAVLRCFHGYVDKSVKIVYN